MKKDKWSAPSKCELDAMRRRIEEECEQNKENKDAMYNFTTDLIKLRLIKFLKKNAYTNDEYTEVISINYVIDNLYDIFNLDKEED